jgi:hypothetical protein
MLTNEQRAMVLSKGEEWHGFLSFAIDRLRKRIREACQDPLRPLPKYKVDDVLAYVLTRALVETTCMDVIGHIAARVDAAYEPQATGHESPAAAEAAETKTE